jgi:DNA-directed RNA polymerase specialized sigma24 family protein
MKSKKVDTDEILALFYDEGMTAKEISELTGYSRTTIHSIIREYRNEYNNQYIEEIN